MKLRQELDKFREETEAKAAIGHCEGSCEHHSGDVVATRVHHVSSDMDWGWFSYCETARKTDAGRGMELHSRDSSHTDQQTVNATTIMHQSAADSGEVRDTGGKGEV